MAMPTGWTIATLAELGQWSSGGTPSRKNSAYFGGDIPWVLTGDLTDGPIYGVSNSITIAGLKESSAKVFPINTLLVAMYGATIGKLGTLRIEAATNQACAALLPNAANEETLPYAYYYLLSQRENLRKSGKGGAQPNISQTVLKEFPIPLAPKDEQVRIVEKIETLFTQLDQGEASLRSVQTLLTRYRQSVLKSAVTGQLTADWRQDESSDPRRGTAGWRSARLGELVLDLRYGTAKKCLPSSKGTAVLRIPNVANGAVDLSDLKFAELDKNELEKLALRKGDLLVVRSNGSASLVGRGALVDEAAEGLAFAGYLIRLRIDQTVLIPEFLHLYLESPVIRAKIEREARSTSGVHNINSAELKAIEVRFPDISMQQSIVEEVRAQLSKLAYLESQCDMELTRSTALRQSILKDAFAGRLVPQDPNDEPASALLARIRAERDAASKPAARGRGKAGSPNANSQHAKGAR